MIIQTHCWALGALRSSRPLWSLQQMNNQQLRTEKYVHSNYRRQQEPAIQNLQVVITHASHVCSQHLFGLPLRMNGMHRMQTDHARFDLLPLVI